MAQFLGGHYYNNCDVNCIGDTDRKQLLNRKSDLTIAIFFGLVRVALFSVHVPGDDEAKNDIDDRYPDDIGISAKPGIIELIDVDNEYAKGYVHKGRQRGKARRYEIEKTTWP